MSAKDSLIEDISISIYNTLSMSQQYENYWKITLGYSDIYGTNFNKCLAVILAFIDAERATPYSKEKYQKLQDRIQNIFGGNAITVRKRINQYIKLGFVRSKLIAYHPAAKTFFNEQDRSKKRSLFSKIVYSHSSFNSSVKKETNERAINFFINTLIKVGKLEKDDVLALMTVDITRVAKGYYTREELQKARKRAEKRKFKTRKYNQLGHFWSILKNLDHLKVTRKHVTFQESTSTVEDEETKKRNRDPYLQQIYKAQLEEEAKKYFGYVGCMVEGLPYPSHVASHIKPLSLSSKEEMFDANNGLLLSRNIDLLFDKGYISFTTTGNLLLSKRIDNELKKYLHTFSLHAAFLTPERLAYLKYHRERVFS